MASTTSCIALEQVARECITQARSLAPLIASRADLNTHNSLIATACQALADAIQRGGLPINDDIRMSTLLAELLLRDTASSDLAETYLSAVRQRLQRYMPGGPQQGPYFNQWLYVEFMALYEVPRHGLTGLGTRAALNNCAELVAYLETLEDRTWCSVFMWVQAGLYVRLKRFARATAMYRKLWTVAGDMEPQWRAFVAVQYTMWLLESRQEVMPELVNVLEDPGESVSGNPQLSVLVLVVRLLLAVHCDENIAPLLGQFKVLFDTHKSALLDGAEPLVIPLGVSSQHSPELVINHPAVFNYTSLKTLLLFLQSVSYLVNCYDDAANFSVRFLPKVKRNIKKALKGGLSSDKSCALDSHDSVLSWHTQLMEQTQFYQGWESMLLTGSLSDTLSEYLGAQNTEEIRLLTQLNEYLALAGQIDEIKETDTATQQVLLVRAEQSWSSIETALASSPLLRNNAMWDATIVVVWFMSHQEPFTTRPLPSSDATRSKYMQLLTQYYNANRLVKGPAKSENDPHTLKKAVWLLALVNYLGGRLLETDLEEIYAVSSACLQITKGRRLAAPYIQYVLTLWHLLNCTVSMRSREVILTRGRLESLVRESQMQMQIQRDDA